MKTLQQDVTRSFGRRSSGCLSALAIAVMVLLAAGWPAQAQTNFYWTNSAGTATTPWSTAANWTNGTPAANGKTNYWLNFSVAGAYSASNDLAGNLALNRMNIGAGTVSLYGNPLVLTNNGATMPVITNYSGNPATLNNNITLGSNATISAAADIMLNGVVDGPGTLTKSGAKTLTLAGVNTYSGATTVSVGSLLVNSPGAIASAVTVSSGSTLGGSGVISNFVTVSTGGSLAPGGVSTVGKLTLTTNLTISGGGMITFDLIKPGTAGTDYDQVVVGGTNATYGIQVNPLTGTLTNGSYTLMTYLAKNSSINAFFPNGATNWGALTLTNGATSLTLGVGADTTFLTWNGSNDVWDLATTANWLGGGIRTTYANGNYVTFDDTATNCTITGTTVSPSYMTVNNSISNYVFSTTFAGSGTLLKLGSKALTLNGASTLGSVVLDGATGGALVLSNNLTTSSLSLQNTSGATATHTNTIAAGQALTVNGPVSVGNLTSIPFVQTTDHFTGGGTLAVSGTATNLYVGSANPNAVAGNPWDTLNLSGLGNFTATINTLGVGYAGGVSQGRPMNGILILATNNTITATNLIVGAGSGQPGYGQLQLGTTSTLNISNICVGGNVLVANAGEGLVMFNPALTSPGTVTIRGVSGGTSSANLNLNYNFTGTANRHDQVDFTGGILDARFGTVNLAYQNANNGIYSAVMAIGQTAGAHADFTGGTLTVGRLTASGSTVSTLPASFYIGTTNGTASMTAGTVVLADSGANNYALPLPLAGTFTVGTNATVTVNNNLYMGKKGNGVTNATATLNLNAGGTLVIPAGGIVTTNTYSGANTITTNSITFDGGTLRASSSGTLLAGNNASISILSGGATFDTGAYSVTNALSLAAATGNGIAGLVVTNGGSGYLTAPYVNITDATGSGASAFAKLNAAGQVTNIVVTSRGQNYTSPTITFVGAVYVVAPNIGGATGVVTSVTGGGLTKLGSGTLTLSGTNTYIGATTVNNGTLKLAATGSISNSPVINVVGGAVFDVSAVSGYTVLASQTLKGLGQVNGSVTIASGATLECNYNTAAANVMNITGTLTLPASLILNVNGTGPLPSSVVLFSAGTILPTDLSGWTVNCSAKKATTRAIVSGNQVKLVTPSGLILSIH